MNLYANQRSYFGHQQGGYLFTHNGKCAVKFDNEKMYGICRQYLGQLSKTRYLVTGNKFKDEMVANCGHADGEAVSINPHQFGKIRVDSLKYTGFKEVDEF